jgi:hypothetical protein
MKVSHKVKNRDKYKIHLHQIIVKWQNNTENKDKYRTQDPSSIRTKDFRTLISLTLAQYGLTMHYSRPAQPFMWCERRGAKIWSALRAT